jgi:hypothetical protein
MTSDSVSSHIAILSNMSCDLPAMALCVNKQKSEYKAKKFYVYMNSVKNVFIMMSPLICVMEDIGKHLELIRPHGTGGN